MSGIEVAGLLLGTFPLLISALEHYRQTAEVLEDWWQIKKEYKKCKNEIKVQELVFENNLERFLLPLVVDDDDVNELMSEPGGLKWRDPALEQKLIDRLPRSYDLFLDIMHDIQATMEGLQEELGLNRTLFQKELGAHQEKVCRYFFKTRIWNEWGASVIVTLSLCMLDLLKLLFTRPSKILDLDLDYLRIQLVNGGSVDSNVASLD